jgi:DNA-binding MarR family transcriptional regulator
MKFETVSDEQYARLLAVRTRLREFERWSAAQASAFGLTASQHQLLLAVRGHDNPLGPTIGQVADYLLIRPHSAAELVDRAEQLGLVLRRRDQDDHRVVRLTLSVEGQSRLQALSAAHLGELAQLTPLLHELLGDASG